MKDSSYSYIAASGSSGKQLSRLNKIYADYISCSWCFSLLQPAPFLSLHAWSLSEPGITRATQSIS
jgi:hypothetical protein